MTIEYFARDERPYWEATVEVEGALEDLSAGYTFEVNISPYPVRATTVPLVTKTTGITGATAGVVTVAWAPEELDLAPATYAVQLTATRTVDGKDWTVEDQLLIKPRLT